MPAARAALAIALALPALARADVAPPPVHVEAVPAPPIQTPITTVDAPKLTALLKAHASGAVIVNVFASWCKPCVREFPYLARIARSYPDVYVIGIDLDDEEAPLTKFLGGLKVRPTFEIVRKGTGDPRPMLVRAGILKKGKPLNLPTTILIEAGGRVARRIEGELDPEALGRDLGELRAASTPTAAPTVSPIK